jgi:hypothetical protein
MDYLAALARLNKIVKIQNCLAYLARGAWLNCSIDLMGLLQRDPCRYHYNIFLSQGNHGHCCKTFRGMQQQQ